MPIPSEYGAAEKEREWRARKKLGRGRRHCGTFVAAQLNDPILLSDASFCPTAMQRLKRRMGDMVKFARREWGRCKYDVC